MAWWPFTLSSVFSDSIFEPSQLSAFQEGIMSWSPKEKTYETDLAVLQGVEELEQRVILSDLQIRVLGLALGRGLLKGGRYPLGKNPWVSLS